MDISAVALHGLQQATMQVDASAGRLVAATAPAPEGMPVDTVSLSEAAVALLGARNQFSANIELLKTANEMQKNLVNILA